MGAVGLSWSVGDNHTMGRSRQLQQVALWLTMLAPILHCEPTFENLMELPMNMAGYMSVERASDECEEQVITAVDITIEEANKRCEEAVRQNIYNIERQDDDVIEQVMEATRSSEEKKCKHIIETSLKEAEILFEKKCATYTEQAAKIARNEVDAECRVIIDKKLREAHCRAILQQEVVEQKKAVQVQCSIDSQVAVQHAVDTAMQAGQDALIAAVEQTEKRCGAQLEQKMKEAAMNASEECAKKTEYRIKEAEDRVKKEWGKDLVNLRKLFKAKMEEARGHWISEMIVKTQSFTEENIQKEELNQISSDAFFLLDEGSGSLQHSLH